MIDSLTGRAVLTECMGAKEVRAIHLEVAVSSRASQLDFRAWRFCFLQDSGVRPDLFGSLISGPEVTRP